VKETNFFRGLIFGLLVSVPLWAIFAVAVTAAHHALQQ
jgi:hypothetical protein